jgi:DNA-directed RNA polymerase subunit RPC12/RpoP
VDHIAGGIMTGFAKLSCAFWGHAVDNHVFRASDRQDRRCRCGAPYLREDGTLTHVRHTLSCFLRHHTYVRLADRDGAHEYVCVKCGHPLLYPEGSDPFTERATFTKKVRYLCGLFGHRVQQVSERDGFTEYTCHCGHSFLRAQAGEKKIRHPLACFFRAHRVRFVTRRRGYAEYVCDDCGHPFCFALGAEGAEAAPCPAEGAEKTALKGWTTSTAA